jgi:hypothetical protein
LAEFRDGKRSRRAKPEDQKASKLLSRTYAEAVFLPDVFVPDRSGRQYVLAVPP